MAGNFREGIAQRTIEEYETEAILSGRGIVVVEGPSDARVYGDILVELGINVSLVPIGAVAPPSGGFELEFSAQAAHVELGARDKVAQLAGSYGDGEKLLFVADLDVDYPREVSETPECLLYTDFPGLESYWIIHSNLAWFVRIFDLFDRSANASLDERVEAERAAIEALLQQLGRFLVILYRLRRVQRDQRSDREFPKELRKYRAGSNYPHVEPDTPKLCRALGVDPADVSSELPSLSMGTVREHAYGHDVAATLWACLPRMRNDFGIRRSDDLERILTSQITAERVAEFPLFQSIAEWASRAESSQLE